MKDGISKRDFVKKSLLGTIFGIFAPKATNYNIKNPLIALGQSQDDYLSLRQSCRIPLANTRREKL